MGLGKRINQIRKEKKISLDELALLSGVPKGTLSKITAEITTNPTLETVQSIARALGCTIDDFDDAPSNKKNPVPAFADTGNISLDESNALLVALGYIAPGEQLSDRDLAFLEHVIGLLDAWFERH